MQNLIKFHGFVHKILSGNEILTITKDHNCVAYLQKLTHNNSNLDLVNVKAYAKYGLIPSIRFQDIERNWSQNTGMMKWQNQWMMNKLTPCPAKYIKMPHPLLIFSQSDYLSCIVAIKFTNLMANSADPDQLASSDCWLRQGISGFSRTRVKM